MAVQWYQQMDDNRFGKDLFWQRRWLHSPTSKVETTAKCSSETLRRHPSSRDGGGKTCIQVSQIWLQEQNIRDVQEVQGIPLCFQEEQLLFEVSYQISKTLVFSLGLTGCHQGSVSRTAFRCPLWTHDVFKAQKSKKKKSCAMYIIKYPPSK